MIAVRGMALVYMNTLPSSVVEAGSSFPFLCSHDALFPPLCLSSHLPPPYSFGAAHLLTPSVRPISSPRAGLSILPASSYFPFGGLPWHHGFLLLVIDVVGACVRPPFLPHTDLFYRMYEGLRRVKEGVVFEGVAYSPASSPRARASSTNILMKWTTAFDEAEIEIKRAERAVTDETTENVKNEGYKNFPYFNQRSCRIDYLGI